MRPTVSVDALYQALGRFVVRFRWPIVAFWILAAVATSAALPPPLDAGERQTASV